MNYSKLQFSFFVLFIMTLIQLFVSVFIIDHLVIACLSLIAMLLCLCGIFFTSRQTKKK